MKELINLLDSETRAMSFVQLELWRKLLNQKCYTKNEEKIKAVLNERFCRVIDTNTAFQTLVTKLKDMDEFEMLHGVDVDELLDED